MIFGEFIDELQDRLKLEKPTDEVRRILGRKVNQAYGEVGEAHDWEQLKRVGELTTVPNYTEGSVTVTDGSRTVTGTGTWTSAMEGRYFNVDGDDNWYRIVRVVSSSELTLQEPIIRSSSSGLTYTIWKRFYYLPSEVRKILNFHTWFKSDELRDSSERYLIENYSRVNLTGEPESFVMYGADPFERTYSDGTITTTKDSDLMTGTSTLWLGNVSAGDIVDFGKSENRVKRVESDTRIRLVSSSDATRTSQTYTIRVDTPIGLQLMFNPNSEIILPFTYIKHVYPMINADHDRPELVGSSFDLAILDGAEASKLRDMDDQKWSLKLQEYQARVRFLKATRSYSSKPKVTQMQPRIPTRSGY